MKETLALVSRTEDLSVQKVRQNNCSVRTVKRVLQLFPKVLPSSHLGCSVVVVGWVCTWIGYGFFKKLTDSQQLQGQLLNYTNFYC